MKFAVAAASLLASVHSQTLAPTANPTANPTTPKLDAECVLENSIEKLVIEIPYPEAQNANILYLEAGSCSASNYLSLGGNMTTSNNNMVTLSLPIDACDIRGNVYQVPTVNMTRSYGLIKPTATVTFGQNIGGMDVIFRRLPIAAECGTRTSYTVKFDYKDVTQVDADGCTIVDDVCVFPAYGKEAKFVIKEYTNSNFDVEVDNDNLATDDDRAFVAGSEIFLSMQVTDMPADLKFAVTECKVTDGAKSLILLNPGADASAVPPPSCKIDEIGLSGTYEGFEKFNFQHILFLLDATLDANTFTLECEVEVCNRNDASSICNRAASVCINDSTDVTDSTAVLEKDRMMKDWMCDGLCGLGNEDQCSVDANVVSCKSCTCTDGVGAIGSTCPVDKTEACVSCDAGYQNTGGACVTPPEIYKCNDAGAREKPQEYKDSLSNIYPNTCSFDPSTKTADMVDYTLTATESEHMKVWYFKANLGDQVSHGDAMTFCTDRGLTMAKTHSTAERDAAVNMQTTNQYWWIGIKWKWYDGAANIHEVPHNRRMYRLYRWQDTDQFVCIDHLWRQGQPANPEWEEGTAPCHRVVPTDNRIEGRHCGYKASVICEYRCGF